MLSLKISGTVANWFIVMLSSSSHPSKFLWSTWRRTPCLNIPQKFSFQLQPHQHPNSFTPRRVSAFHVATIFPSPNLQILCQRELKTHSKQREWFPAIERLTSEIQLVRRVFQHGSQLLWHCSKWTLLADLNSLFRTYTVCYTVWVLIWGIYEQ